MKENQELQIIKEAVNIGTNHLNFEEKEKVIHCFRTVQVQLQQFAQLKDEHSKLQEEVKTLREDFNKVDGKPKKVMTK